MKGQAAVEYLMTYGWMIVAVIVISAALYSLGVFNPSTWVQKNARGFSAFEVKDWSITQSGLNLVLGVKTTSSVNITSVEANFETGSCSSSVGRKALPGETVSLQVSCTNVPSAGTLVNLNTTISFVNLDSGLSHRDYGILTGKVE
ncbi:MAG: hypothetical protein GXO63_02835 [Candidatus Micrarchaeota archaeon]|nr:hypothetical protein [Candidatus Micrarchaeota archaeon]